MEPIAKGASSIPLVSQAGSTDAQGSAADALDTSFWSSFLMVAAMTSIAIGITWDISWHETIGRDTFWTPAHIAIYFGGVVAGCVAGWLAIKHTFFGGQDARDSSVGVFGARAPLGAWIAIWGAIAMITAGPFDDWWHNAYGLDVKIVSPPHAVLGLGMFGISVGVLLLVLARQNRFPDSSTRGSGLFIYTGGVFVLLGSVFILEYIFPNEQHGGMFYKVCAIMYPTRLVALSYAGRTSWPATRVAAVYMGFVCIMNWVLVQFPAQPKLAPIFNPVTHMVPLPFPLLLVFPAFAVDLVLIKARNVRSIWKLFAFAVPLGMVFLAVLIPVQWFFATYMISPSADNWFFMGNRIWGYNASMGDWHYQFWRQNPGSADVDLFTVRAVIISLAIASVSSSVGLFFGHWMRKVRR